MAVRTLFPLIQGGNKALWRLLPFATAPVTPAVPVVNFNLEVSPAVGTLSVAGAGSLAVPAVVGSLSVAAVDAGVTISPGGNLQVGAANVSIEVESELP